MHMPHRIVRQGPASPGAYILHTLTELVVDQLSVINNICRKGMRGSRKTRRNFFRSVSDSCDTLNKSALGRWKCQKQPGSGARSPRAVGMSQGGQTRSACGQWGSSAA